MAWHCRPVVLVIAASLAVSGCATTGGASEPGATPAQARLRRQAGADTDWTTATGCAVGTLLGVGLGALLAGQHDRGKGALWGGGLGAAAGCASGYYVASTNNQYASEQDALRA